MFRILSCCKNKNLNSNAKTNTIRMIRLIIFWMRGVRRNVNEGEVIDIEIQEDAFVLNLKTVNGGCVLLIVEFQRRG